MKTQRGKRVVAHEGKYKKANLCCWNNGTEKMKK